MPSYSKERNLRHSVTATHDHMVNGVWSRVEEVTWTDSGSYLLTEGDSIEHFHKRQKAGELMPFTMFRQYETKVLNNGGGLNCLGPSNDGDRWSAQSYTYNGLTYSRDALLAITSEFDPGVFLQMAAGNLYARGFDASTFLLELHKNIAMFNDAVKRIGQGFKGPVTSLRETLDKTSNAWLQGRYGWRTFVMDMENLYVSQKRLKNKLDRYKERAGHQESWTIVSSVPISGYYVTGLHKRTDSVSLSLGATVVADIRWPEFAFNPLVTGWELIPYSFIVDWIISVGQALNALSFSLLQTNYQANTHGKIVVNTHRFSDVTFNPGCTGEWWVAGDGVSEFSWRNPESVRLQPYFDPYMSIPRAVDAAAILYKLFKK